MQKPSHSVTEAQYIARMGLVGTVDTGEAWGKILCVSAHLENNCSPNQRRVQFTTLVNRVMEDEFVKSDPKIIIGGDMNTLVTGWARLYDAKGRTF